MVCGGTARHGLGGLSRLAVANGSNVTEDLGGHSATIEHNCVRHLARILLGGTERIVRLTWGHRGSESAVTPIESRSVTQHHDPEPVAILGRFGFRRRREKRTCANHLLPPPKSAVVYVDVENLKDARHARAVIETVVRDWPESLPPLRRLHLYAPADKTGLWGAWASARFPDLQVGVRGVQRFARVSKNSADMAIVADAVADFTTGVVNHIAVVSNDSDFGALFVKIQELAFRSDQTEQPPFLWINLYGGAGLSSEIQEFVPERLRWEVAVPVNPKGGKSSKPAEDGGVDLPSNSTIARWVLDEIPPGKFRAEDVRKIIKRHCPTHPAAQTTMVCGQFLAQQLMPLLEKRNISMVRQQPRTYEKAG